MTNFIKKLKQVAAGRTKGKWHWWSDSICGYEPYTDGSKGPGSRIEIIKTDSRVYPPEDNDADFIITAANCFDELVACAETLALYARSPNDGRTRTETVPMIDFEDASGPARRALTALRQKVEGGGG